jgi:hypothetical protein
MCAIWVVVAIVADNGSSTTHQVDELAAISSRTTRFDHSIVQYRSADVHLRLDNTY